jgi:hypothetical protein
MKIRSLLLVALAVAACDSGGVELETRTFRIESLPPGKVQEIVAPYVFRDREANPGALSVTEGALTVRETADNLARIERVLEEFDRPEGTLRLRFQVIEADGAEGTDPEIASVEEELRKLFRFEGYRLTGEGVITVADGAEFNQDLTGRREGWHVSGRVWRTSNAVRIDEVQLWGPEPLFETSVNIRPGQTLVLGSARAPEGSGAIILVVEAVEES